MLRNFRRYEDAKFNFHERFTVLIGNNGAGKTTVLDAMAMALNTYFQGSKITTGGGTIKKDDARLIITEKGSQTFREPQKEVYLESGAYLHGNYLTWVREISDRGGKAKELVKFGTEDREKIANGESPDLPLLLYYGAGRLWDVHQDIDTEKPNSQLDAYRYCLDPKSDQKAFEKWFKKLAYSELQKKQSIPAMMAIKSAVQTCIPGAKDFYYDTDADQIMIKLDKEGLVPFNYLSDGYRNMVAMVADIAHRASRLNPHFDSDSAKKTQGIVLIDEIDLHLHPKWQRRVVDDLQKAFPNIQFVATTHSPFIIQSLKAGEVIDLDQKMSIDQVGVAPLGVAAPAPTKAFSDRSIEDIVEDVMGVSIPQRSKRYEEMYAVAKEYYLLLEQGVKANQEEKEALKVQLDQLSAPFSDNVAYHAFLEMERIAAGLGKSNTSEAK